MGAKSDEVYSSRAVQREDEADGDIGNPRTERARTRGECPAVSTGRRRAGWRFRRGRGRTTPLGSVGDAGVVVTAVVAAMGNAGMSEQEEGRRYSRVKEETGEKRDRWRRERGETEDEKDLNGKRERRVVGRWGREEGEREREGKTGRRKREIDRGESRVRQVPMVTRHSASWVGFILHPFVHPPRIRFPLVRGIGRLVHGVVIVGAGVANRFSAISLRLPPK